MQLFWINDRIAVATRPRGGDWLRDDLADVQRNGVRTVVSCLTRAEAAELELTAESETARSLGLEFVQIPITDFGIPEPGVVEDGLSRITTSGVSIGKVVIHCRQGLGRSPLVAAAMLVRGGMKPAAAWDAVGRARGRSVPETEEQRLWLNRFATL